MVKVTAASKWLTPQLPLLQHAMQAPAAGGKLDSVCLLDLHLQEALKAGTNIMAKGLVRNLDTENLQICHLQCGYPA